MDAHTLGHNNISRREGAMNMEIVQFFIIKKVSQIVVVAFLLVTPKEILANLSCSEILKNNNSLIFAERTSIQSSVHKLARALYDRIEKETDGVFMENIHPGNKIAIQNILYHVLLNVKQHSTNQHALIKASRTSNTVEILVSNSSDRIFPVRLLREFSYGERIQLTNAERGGSMNAGVSHREIFNMFELLPPESRISWNIVDTTVEFRLIVSLNDPLRKNL